MCKFLNWLNRHDPKAFPAMQKMVKEHYTLYIYGPRGGGKSSSANAFGIAVHHDKERYENMVDAINELKKNNFGNLEIPDTVIASNSRVLLNFFNESEVENYFLDIDDFGIPNKLDDVALLPSYFLKIFDEIETKYNGEAKNVTDFQKEGYMKERHDDQNTILTSQRLTSTAA
ncbi:MAG: hypothetical protein RSB59_00280, partial [Clostridia bacterium]